MEVQYAVGELVRITKDHEGYEGQIATVFAVFKSGNYQVTVGKIALLFLRPDQMEKINEVPD